MAGLPEQNGPLGGLIWEGAFTVRAIKKKSSTRISSKSVALKTISSESVSGLRLIRRGVVKLNYLIPCIQSDSNDQDEAEGEIKGEPPEHHTLRPSTFRGQS